MRQLFVALLSFFFSAAHAQTADEVIQKYTAAMGGLDNINKINTAKISGTLTTQGQNFPITTQIINGKSVRTGVDVMGQAVINVYHNGKGWKINPFDGAPTSVDVTGEELVTFKIQTSLANNLMDYKKRGHQVELLGQEDVDGVKAFKFKLTNKEDGKAYYFFISTGNYMLVKTIAKRKVAGNEYDAETFFSEIQEINGVKFSMHFTQKIQGTVFQEVHYDKIELNVPVDERIFDRPK